MIKVLKEIFKILGIVFAILLVLGLIVYKMIINSIDELNKKSIESYVTSIRYAYTAYMYKNLVLTTNIDELNIKSNVKVECAKKSIDLAGNVELHECSVEGSKRLYKYVNGYVNYEGNKK